MPTAAQNLAAQRAKILAAQQARAAVLAANRQAAAAAAAKRQADARAAIQQRRNDVQAAAAARQKKIADAQAAQRQKILDAQAAQKQKVLDAQTALKARQDAAKQKQADAAAARQQKLADAAAAKLVKQQAVADFKQNLHNTTLYAQIAKFDAKLGAQIATLGKRILNPQIQRTLINEQQGEVVYIAKQGGLYTPTPLDQLSSVLAQAEADSAAGAPGALTNPGLTSDTGNGPGGITNPPTDGSDVGAGKSPGLDGIDGLNGAPGGPGSDSSGGGGGSGTLGDPSAGSTPIDWKQYLIPALIGAGALVVAAYIQKSGHHTVRIVRHR